MIEFLLVIEEVELNSTARTGRALHKVSHHPVFPRAGEIIMVGGNNSPVTEVLHNLEGPTEDCPHPVIVYICREGFDFTSLWNDQDWKQYQEPYLRGKSI
jgi:hypothetical protein